MSLIYSLYVLYILMYSSSHNNHGIVVLFFQYLYPFFLKIQLNSQDSQWTFQYTFYDLLYSLLFALCLSLPSFVLPTQSVSLFIYHFFFLPLSASLTSCLFPVHYFALHKSAVIHRVLFLVVFDSSLKSTHTESEHNQLVQGHRVFRASCCCFFFLIDL